MMCQINWPLVVEFLKVIPTVIVAGLVGLVAYRQWQTAKDKLALDLFDRRLAMHKKLLLLFGRMGVEPMVQMESLLPIRISRAEEELKREMAEARFLFGDRVRDHLDVVRETIRDEIFFRDTMSKAAENISEMSGEEAHDMMGQWTSRMAATKQQIAAYVTMIEPYMMLDTISVNRPRSSAN